MFFSSFSLSIVKAIIMIIIISFTWYENDNVEYVWHVNFISDNVNNQVHLIF